MEELKILIGMVEKLPTLALWVIAFFFAYKVIVVGSVYGVIRFVVGKAAEAYRLRKENVELRATIDGMCITCDGSHLMLMSQLDRLRGIHLNDPRQSITSYIHAADVRWLQMAIDDKLLKDKKEVSK